MIISSEETYDPVTGLYHFSVNFAFGSFDLANHDKNPDKKEVLEMIENDIRRWNYKEEKYNG